MTLPRATYRLQFRHGMDFDRAASLAPYLSRLGISHLYASPLFQAVPGSTHGYDVTDHGRFDESLGGMEGFLRLSAALKAEDLGLILDIVPNHMAASPHNPWWRDVLRHGRESTYSGHFDIDWSAPRLLLPVLGQPYGAALEAGEFSLGYDADGLTWRYHETALPLDPRRWQLVLGPADLGRPEGGNGQSPYDFARWIADTANGARLTKRLRQLSRDPGLLDRVHAAQPWRLAYWRAARDMLTYRRFFGISDLVGVRVEEERVFNDVHRLLFEMLADGHVDGVRVDHVDGLADPACYLRRLKDEAPGHPPIWVEKILAPDEMLPCGWPVEGTTGYEFGCAVGGLLTDPRGTTELTAAYGGFVDEASDLKAMLAVAKCEILTHNFAAELSRLTALAIQAAAEDPVARDWGPDTLRRALIAIAMAMPVYRTYLDADCPSPVDTALLQRVESEAVTQTDLEDPAAISDILRLMATAQGVEARRLRTRFQQTTGALMAKAMEDTLFYRYTRLLSANEVGSEPGRVGLAAAEFDREILARAGQQPGGLNTTATHDTKRGEDARMRIAAITDAPGAWRDAVRQCDALLAGEDDADAPDRGMRWLFYQALLGAWEPGDLTGLAERLSAFMVKAAREAKCATSWTRPNEAYETQLTAFAKRALTDSPGFPPTFGKMAAPFITGGERKSLVQLALKLALPGIPDIYQGTEWPDLSLVDPDNRRPVDFDARIAALDEPAAEDASFARLKMDLLRHLLAARRKQPELFEKAGYRMLRTASSSGNRYFGFGRDHAGTVLLVLSELSGSAEAAKTTPRFLLPEAWRSIKIQSCYPKSGIDRAGESVSPRAGFDRIPVLVALGTTRPGQHA